MNTEEAIRKIAAILDENRELKETIYELNTDRDWWRTSALDTDITRARLSNELDECRNMIDEQNARIEGLEASLADRERQFNELDDMLDQTRGLLHAAMDRIQEQNNEIAKITEQRDNEADNRRRVAKHLQHCIGERDATIEELNAELAARNEDSIMLIKVVQLIKSWEECHNVKYIHRIHTTIEDYINTKKEERT